MHFAPQAYKLHCTTAVQVHSSHVYTLVIITLGSIYIYIYCICLYIITCLYNLHFKQSWPTKEPTFLIKNFQGQTNYTVYTKRSSNDVFSMHCSDIPQRSKRVNFYTKLQNSEFFIFKIFRIKKKILSSYFINLRRSQKEKVDAK